MKRWISQKIKVLGEQKFATFRKQWNYFMKFLYSVICFIIIIVKSFSTLKRFETTKIAMNKVEMCVAKKRWPQKNAIISKTVTKNSIAYLSVKNYTLIYSFQENMRDKLF